MDINKCPQCKSDGTVREIIWGMPDGPVDESKYLLGGCCISPDGIDPTHECIECGWQNKKAPQITTERFGLN